MQWIPERYRNALKVIIGLTLFIWLLSLVDLREVLDLFRQGDLWLFGVGFFIMLVAYCGFHAMRFHWCVRKISPDVRTSYRLFFVGYLFNNLFPGSAGGDAVRMYYLRRMDDDAGWGKPAGLLLIYRLTGLVTLALAGFIYMIFHFDFIADAFRKYATFDFTPGLRTGLIVGGIVVSGALLLFSKALKEAVVKLVREILATFRLFDGQSYAGIIGLSYAFHFTRMAGLYFLVLFFGGYLELIHLLFVLFITGFIISIPISFGALGLMEGAIGGSLILFDVSVGAATGVALANRLVLVLIAGIGGFVYLVKMRNGIQGG